MHCGCSKFRVQSDLSVRQNAEPHALNFTIGQCNALIMRFSLSHCCSLLILMRLFEKKLLTFHLYDIIKFKWGNDKETKGIKLNKRFPIDLSLVMFISVSIYFWSIVIIDRWRILLSITSSDDAMEFKETRTPKKIYISTSE